MVVGGRLAAAIVDVGRVGGLLIVLPVVDRPTDEVVRVVGAAFVDDATVGLFGAPVVRGRFGGTVDLVVVVFVAELGFASLLGWAVLLSDGNSSFFCS